MKCPHCEETVSVPSGRKETINGIIVLVLGCPHCHKILGAVGPATTPTATSTPTPTPESITRSELMALLHRWGGVVTISGTSLAAVINGVTYKTTVPKSWGAFEEFKTEINQGKISISYQAADRE